MEFFRIRRTIHFMRFDKIFNTISLISFIIAVFLLCTRGLALSIEFTGGDGSDLSASRSHGSNS